MHTSIIVYLSLDTAKTITYTSRYPVYHYEAHCSSTLPRQRCYQGIHPHSRNDRAPKLTYSPYLFMNFTTAQREAINHTKGNLQLIACAGSGKTEVVARRVANLLKTSATPRNIVAFTFTEKAAAELKERIIIHSGPMGTQNSSCDPVLKRVCGWLFAQSV